MAADYGLSNLSVLQTKGYNVAGLNDAEKAKMIYLTHHPGVGDAVKFIDNTITEARAKVLLTAQVGAAKALAYANKNEGLYLPAHRKWLSEFIDKMIKVEERYCPHPVNNQIVSGKDLLKIIENL